VRKDREKKSEK
jgi:hypothetical protein